MGSCYTKNSGNSDKESELTNNLQPKAKAGTNGNTINYKFLDEVLKAHNLCRQKHGVPPLSLNFELSEYSQSWADNLSKKNLFEHSDLTWNNIPVGENISICAGQEVTGKFMTDMWYNEHEKYDYNNPGFDTETGHFTQIIWKDSKYLGVGIAQNKEGTYYVVANYAPPGNVGETEEFANNVPAVL